MLLKMSRVSPKGRTRISKKGNSRIRRALHMPALGVVMWKQKPFVNLYQRTLEKHNLKIEGVSGRTKKVVDRDLRAVEKE